MSRVLAPAHAPPGLRLREVRHVRASRGKRLRRARDAGRRRPLRRRRRGREGSLRRGISGLPGRSAAADAASLPPPCAVKPAKQDERPIVSRTPSWRSPAREHRAPVAIAALVIGRSRKLPSGSRSIPDRTSPLVTMLQEHPATTLTKGETVSACRLRPSLLLRQDGLQATPLIVVDRVAAYGDF